VWTLSGSGLDARQSELAFESESMAIHDLIYVAVVVRVWDTSCLSPGCPACHLVVHTSQELLPDNRIIVDIKHWFHLFMFDYFSNTVCFDKIVGRVTRFWKLTSLPPVYLSQRFPFLSFTIIFVSSPLSVV